MLIYSDKKSNILATFAYSMGITSYALLKKDDLAWLSIKTQIFAQNSWKTLFFRPVVHYPALPKLGRKEEPGVMSPINVASSVETNYINFSKS